MTLQARQSEWDNRLYNVNRDVAHNFGDVVREVAQRLEDGHWPHLKAMLERDGITEDDLGKACEGFMLFVASAVEHPKERMEACLRRCGYLDAPESAQVAYMAILGTVMAGYYWVGAREATISGTGPCLTYQDLREAGKRSSQILSMPKWQRRWYQLRQRVTAVMDALLGRTSRIQPTPLNRNPPCTPKSNPTAPPSALPSSPDSPTNSVPSAETTPSTSGSTSLPLQTPAAPEKTAE